MRPMSAVILPLLALAGPAALPSVADAAGRGPPAVAVGHARPVGTIGPRMAARRLGLPAARDGARGVGPGSFGRGVRGCGTGGTGCAGGYGLGFAGYGFGHGGYGGGWGAAPYLNTPHPHDVPGLPVAAGIQSPPVLPPAIYVVGAKGRAPRR